MNNKQKLEQLLNDYFNSEASYYYNLKEKLLAGVKLNFQAPKISGIIKDPMQAFDFVHMLSANNIDVGYRYSQLDHNIKLFFFEDEYIDLKIYCDQTCVFSKKISLTDYSAYQITKAPLPLERKKANYEVSIKIVKSGSLRLDYEKNCIENPSDYALPILKELHTTISNWQSYSLEEDYPEVYNTLIKRIQLWGMNAKNEAELKSCLKNLVVSDLGIKDIVLITYLPDMFFKEKMSNSKMIKQLNTILIARKNYYEDLCLKMKSLT